MNFDELEQRIKRAELRHAPHEWRAQILHAAQAESVSRPSTLDPRPTSRWREWLWPCPQAWAGVAAAWAVILGLHFSSDARFESDSQSQARAMPSVEMLAIRQEQERILAELLGGLEVFPAEKPKRTNPQPRSERRIEWVIV